MWPITISLKDGVFNLSSQGRPLLPPVFNEDVSHKTKKSVTKSALNLINLLSNEIALVNVMSASVFDASQSLDDWHALLMEDGAESYPQYNLYLDLSLPLEKIKSLFRKRYKSLITWKRLWKVEFYLFVNQIYGKNFVPCIYLFQEELLVQNNPGICNVFQLKMESLF